MIVARLSGLIACVLVARTLAQTQSPVLENDSLRVSFDPVKGGLLSFVHKTSGVDLRPIKSGTVPLAWNMGISMPDGSQEITDSNRTIGFSFTSSSTPNSSALVLTWHGFFTDKGTQHPNAIVQLTVTLLVGETQTLWHWKASSLGSLVINRVTFPYITGVGPLGSDSSDDVLLWPSEDGRLFHDPYHNLSGYHSVGPSGLLNMQFVAYYDTHSGFFFSFRDAQGFVKGVNWAKSFTFDTASDFQIYLYHNQDLVPRDSLEVPYDVVVGVFTGDWSTAADLYKAWAYGQSWVAGAKTKQTPPWLLHDTGVGYRFCTYGCANGAPQQTYAKFIQLLQDRNSLYQMPVLAQLLGWEHYGEWRYGDWFPPEEGWFSFDQTMSSAHALSDRTYLIISPWLIDTSTGLWQSGAMSASAILNMAGELVTDSDAGHTWAYMDISTAAWRQNVLTAGITLASHSVDAIQLDQFPITPPVPCFNPAHSHPPGAGGNWQSTAFTDFIGTFRSAIRAVKPDIAVSGETGAEVFLPWMDVHTSRDNWIEVGEATPLSTEPIPLFQYVYHPWIISLGHNSLGVPMDTTTGYHRLSFARTLVWGQMPSENNSSPSNTPNADPRTFQFIRDIARARTGFARSFLVDGSMLPPLAITSPNVSVTWSSSSGGGAGSGSFPAIQHSEWQAPDGAVGIVLTNISDQTLSVTVPIQRQRLKLDASLSYIVQLTDGASITTLPNGLSADSSFQVDVPSLKVLLLKITQQGSVVALGGTYLGSASITPASPTSADSVAVAISGWVPDTCHPAPTGTVDVSGRNITVNLSSASAATPGMACGQVMTPFTVSVNIGRMPAGSYTITYGMILDGRSVESAVEPLIVGNSLAVATPAGLPSGFIDGSYSETLAATGGAAPYSWSLMSGALPSGLTLNGAGTISGTPTTAGSFNIGVQVRDIDSETATQAFTLTIISATGPLSRYGVFSQVAAGGGWDTTIWLVNRSWAPVPTRLVFHGDDGTSLSLPLTVTQPGVSQQVTAATLDSVIAPNTTLVVATGALASNVQGWADVLSNGALSGFAVFREAEAAEAAVPLQSQLGTSISLPFDNTGGYSTGIAIVNLSGSPANIVATIWDQNGNQVVVQSVALTKTDASGNGHDAFMLPSRLGVTAGMRGIIQFQSYPSSPLAPAAALTGLGLKTDPNGLFTSIPTIVP
jgi:hypothetical protein